MLDLTDAFASFPVLMTERLVLRELTMDDAPAFFRLYSDAQVMRYWGYPPMTESDQARERLADIAAAFRERTGIRWAITRKGAPDLLGSCGHWRLIKSHFRSEIGYELDPAYWGQGIMPEAVSAILQFGFTRMGLHSVEAQIDPANQASRRVLEKLGFVQEGYFRENFYSAGRFGDTAVLSLLKQDWLHRNAA